MKYSLYNVRDRHLPKQPFNHLVARGRVSRKQACKNAKQGAAEINLAHCYSRSWWLIIILVQIRRLPRTRRAQIKYGCIGKY